MRKEIGYFAGKAAELLLTLLLVSLLTFAAFSIIPGDTASVILGPDATPQQVEALREKLGLNKPLSTQYIDWITGSIKGDPGMSAAFNKPVSELIIQRLPVTLGLSVLALIIVLVVAYPTAIISSKKPGKFVDQVFSITGNIAFAIPPFVLSLLVILLMSICFGYFSVGKYVEPSEDFWGYLNCLLLPSFCIAVPKIAMTFKFLRSALIRERGADYVRTAKSHGLSNGLITLKHILPNSNVSAITVISIVLSDILGGSLVIEKVFNLPGLGRLLLDSIGRRDFPLLSGMVLYLATITVLLFFISDILSGLADPRVRLR